MTRQKTRKKQGLEGLRSLKKTLWFLVVFFSFCLRNVSASFAFFVRYFSRFHRRHLSVFVLQPARTYSAYHVNSKSAHPAFLNDKLATAELSTMIHFPFFGVIKY